ncbi:alpha/beta fold hydrolase [Goodfellowiella coeruleoviolacea]|uniref:Pimeloyl-ACP methyl ester carboxylesterase n=1 Tax=Goodfellowiella coeruleoviolacea TaxID=334858 RepID=A0AAE3G8Q2_9PSEU|nr:alpha/beta hydrolase [Goodfellowiella coeruleoviolacea]MCP2163771.1 Pimeloyl-ACP methyl ester carboxylesterase [Goodfellowiella coeruleoviolacea]
MSEDHPEAHPAPVRRLRVDVDQRPASYLTAGERGPIVLLLHGTYWSRVWQPVLPDLAAAGLRPVAVDLPGLGRSGGELTPDTATVPALAAWVARFAAALGVAGPVAVAGHDIGGAIAQHLLIDDRIEVNRLALVNSVTYDSWPVPAVARFRDPAVVASITPDELLAARGQAVTTALARPASEAEIAEYLDPWTDPRVARSWLALAGAADARYTLDLVPALRGSNTPKLLVWGEDDGFQQIRFAERFAAEIPRTTLVRIPGAGHIPMENDPSAVARALIEFFVS